MVMINIPLPTVPTANGRFLVEGGDGPVTRALTDSVEEPGVVADMKADSGEALLTVARMDAVKVLALALNTALEINGQRSGETNGQRLGTAGSGMCFRDEVQRFEAALIRSALTYTGGRQRRAARLLGINVSTMNAKIKRYKISLEELSS